MCISALLQYDFPVKIVFFFFLFNFEQHLKHIIIKSTVLSCLGGASSISGLNHSGSQPFIESAYGIRREIENMLYTHNLYKQTKHNIEQP